jgi:hypothetical protein
MLNRLRAQSRMQKLCAAQRSLEAQCGGLFLVGGDLNCDEEGVTVSPNDVGEHGASFGAQDTASICAADLPTCSNPRSATRHPTYSFRKKFSGNIRRH